MRSQRYWLFFVLIIICIPGVSFAREINAVQTALGPVPGTGWLIDAVKKPFNGGRLILWPDVNYRTPVEFNLFKNNGGPLGPVPTLSELLR